ncbi:MAG: tetrahydromethanopterin S-methyltransferase subunit H [Nitrososphaerota archaeon]
MKLEPKVEQKAFKIGGIFIGGIPGERPTVLMGSMFYKGHKIFVDEEKGIFDKDKAEALIKLQEEFSEKTGNPHVVDVVISKQDIASRLIEFACDKTSAPIAIDVPSKEVGMEVLRYIKGAGLRHPFIYNSLKPYSELEEINLVKDVGCEASILLAYNTKDPFTVRGRVGAVYEMVDKARSTGLEVLLIDTCVIDLPSLGPSLEAIKIVKDELGLPAGCGAHNAVSLWKGLSTKMGKQAIAPCEASSVAVAVAVGSDFVLYGPIENAPIAFPAAAMMDVALSQNRIEKGIRIDRRHPRYRNG